MTSERAPSFKSPAAHSGQSPATAGHCWPCLLADPAHTAWAEEPEIGILKQVCGDNAVPGGNGTPGFNHNDLNLAVTDIRLGPGFRPNARLAVCVTYCDNPAPSGRTFRPEVRLRDKSADLSRHRHCFRRLLCDCWRHSFAAGGVAGRPRSNPGTLCPP